MDDEIGFFRVMKISLTSLERVDTIQISGNINTSKWELSSQEILNSMFE